MLQIPHTAGGQGQRGGRGPPILRGVGADAPAAGAPSCTLCHAAATAPAAAAPRLANGGLPQRVLPQTGWRGVSPPTISPGPPGAPMPAGTRGPGRGGPSGMSPGNKGSGSQWQTRAGQGTRARKRAMPCAWGAFVRALLGNGTGSHQLLPVRARRPPQGDGSTNGTGVLRYAARHAEAAPGRAGLCGLGHAWLATTTARDRQPERTAATAAFGSTEARQSVGGGR